MFILIQETLVTIQTVQLCVQKISLKKKEENKTVCEKKTLHNLIFSWLWCPVACTLSEAQRKVAAASK